MDYSHLKKGTPNMGTKKSERKLTIPMLESLNNSAMCNAWVEKINVRAGNLIDRHDENSVKAETEENLETLSDLMKADQAILQEITFLKTAKASVLNRNKDLVVNEEANIKAYQYDKIDW
jgi:hypothetical protein